MMYEMMDQFVVGFSSVVFSSLSLILYAIADITDRIWKAFGPKIGE